MLKGALKRFKLSSLAPKVLAILLINSFCLGPHPKTIIRGPVRLALVRKFVESAQIFFARASDARGIIYDPFAMDGAPKTSIREPVRFALCLKNHQNVFKFSSHAPETRH